MDFITLITTPIVESLMVPAKRHLGFVFSSTNYVRNMRAKLLELNHTANDMKYKKQTNEANNLVIPDHVSCWLAQVETINKEAGDIPTGGNGCFNIKMRYKAGKGSFNILDKINDLRTQESNIKWTNEQLPLGMVVTCVGPSNSDHLHDGDGTQNTFESRRTIFEDVLKSLQPDSDTQKLALCGMGGVGKTTMMEEIKNVVEKRGMFKWVLRVVVGKNYYPIAIQQDTAEYIGEALTETKREARADRLRKRFEGMSENGTNKILVILDDVWEGIDLKDIGLTSPLPKGFKLLITSRDEMVCIKMDVETTSIFRMVVLEEAEATRLFGEIVRLTDEDGELRKIGEDILRKCGGLPMAIQTIALTLKCCRKRDAWIGALVRLQRHDLEDLYGIMGRIIEISYNNLTKDDDKKIFTLCGLYPDDFDIALEELIRYGWGLQLFDRVDSLVEARQRTNTSVSNLICGNLLTKSYKMRYVKMHDLARVFVLSNISKFNQASIINHDDKSEWPTKDTRESYERILLTFKGETEFPHDFRYPNLELLKIMYGKNLIKFPEDIYKQMEKLKVIAYDMKWYSLAPVSHQLSNGLRTLCLHLCSLEDNDVSFLGDLINLEVLSFTCCGIHKLPSTIGNLKRLRLLNLFGWSDLCIDAGVFQNLEKLEELYIRVSKGQTITFTDANRDELETLSAKLNALEVEFFMNILQPKNVSFKKLKRFRISVGCSLENTNDQYSFTNTLKLVTNRSDLLECKINELFSETEELHLNVKDVTYVEDILVSPTQDSTFWNLRVLHIFECVDLTHLFTFPVAKGLKKLESLTVSSCPMLVSLCDSVNGMELPQLVELKLNGLPSFTSQPLLNKEIVVPKLSKLTLGSMKNLRQIWASGEEDNVSMVREIEVYNYLGTNEQVSSTSTCLRRIVVDGLEELREVWNIYDENNTGLLIRSFQAVESIIIKRCNKFEHVSTPTISNFDLGGLAKIYIKKSVRNNSELVKNSKAAEISGTSKLQGISNVDENTSIVAFPSLQLTHTLQHLRNITFNRFEGVEVVFQIESPRELATTQKQQRPLPLCLLEDLELHNIDTLTHVWKCDNWNILYKHQPQSSFQNLTTIWLYGSNRINYLFSPLMCKLLSSLKKVEIRYCKAMEEVVSNRDDVDDDDDEVTTSTATLLPHLDSLDLRCLDNLKHIGGGGVAKGTKFSQASVVPWSLCQYSTKIHIERCPALSRLIPSFAATQMQKLQKLRLEHCISMVQVFETKEISDNGCSSSSSSYVDQGNLLLPRRKHMTMHHELLNLKILSIIECGQLEYVFTFSVLESLKKLERLTIHGCNSMKVIVKEEQGDESFTKPCRFPRLQSIMLYGLPNLVGFFLGMNIGFEWPSLDYVMVADCPQMMVFTSGESTTPKLKCICTSQGERSPVCGLNFTQGNIF